MIQHRDHDAFLKDALPHAPIGRAVVALSNLELAHDEFILAVNKRQPELAVKLSTKFPRHFRNKTDFLIGCFFALPALRAIPIFGDGTLNLQWLQLQLDELYEIRAVIAHGSIFYSEEHPTGSVYRFDRVVATEGGRWGQVSSTIGTGFLADLVATCELLKHYFIDLRQSVEEGYSWDSVYKTEVEIARNREWMREWVEYGIIEPDPFIDSLLQMDKL